MDKLDFELGKLIDGFKPVLCGDPDFEKGVLASGLKNRERYKYWEWTQGIGLFGIWKLFEKTNKHEYLKILEDYYDERIKEGLPGKNVNTMAPILALSYLAEYTKKKDYMDVCKEWAEWLFPEA